MKIHTKIVIDLNTNNVLEDDWFEYEGPIASCDPVTAAIGGSAVLGAYGANQAAKAQSKAAGDSLSLEYARMDEDTRRYNEMAPYRTAGIGAVNRLTGVLSGTTDPTQAIQSDPGYKFRLSQGQTALDRYLAARGGRLGGSAIKAATRYNQDFASNEYQNYLGNQFRLAGFSGQPTPAPSTAGASNAIMAGGQAQAGMYQGYNNAIQGGLQNYTTYRAYQDQANRLPSYNSSMSFAPQSNSLRTGTIYG